MGKSNAGHSWDGANSSEEERMAIFEEVTERSEDERSEASRSVCAQHGRETGSESMKGGKS